MSERNPYLGWLLLFTASVIVLSTYRGCEGQTAPELPAMVEPLPQRVSGAGPLLPDDPVQRCATKALRGDYPILKPWQRDAYEWVLAKGVTCCGKAKVTSYGKNWESAAMAGGRWTASGSHVHIAGCAANPEIPFGTLIWTSYGLRYVTDRGGWVKVNRRFTRRSETANLDYYTWESWPTLRETPWAIVKRNGDRSVWWTKDKSEVR